MQSVVARRAAAVITGHGCRRAPIDGPIEFVACPQLLTELERTLEKRYFVVRSSPQQRKDFRVLVSERAVIKIGPVERLDL